MSPHLPSSARKLPAWCLVSFGRYGLSKLATAWSASSGRPRAPRDFSRRGELGPGISSASRGGIPRGFHLGLRSLRTEVRKNLRPSAFSWPVFSELGVGRFAFDRRGGLRRDEWTLATAEPVPRRRQACHAEAFGVGGLDVNSPNEISIRRGHSRRRPSACAKLLRRDEQ